MASQVSTYTTKELSIKTLPDFDKLFETHPAPGAYTCYCMYNHRQRALPESQRLDSPAKRAARNRISPTLARSATHSTARGSGTRTACSRR